MKSAVLYASRGGNTSELAKIIGEVTESTIINLNETDISDINIRDFELVFLGSGIYGGRLHNKLDELAEKIDGSYEGKFAFFISWFGRGKSDEVAIKRCKNKLIDKNQKVIDEYYKCYGKGFGLIKRGHPNREELDEAKKWAVKIINQM